MLSLFETWGLKLGNRKQWKVLIDKQQAYCYREISGVHFLEGPEIRMHYLEDREEKKSPAPSGLLNSRPHCYEACALPLCYNRCPPRLKFQHQLKMPRLPQHKKFRQVQKPACWRKSWSWACPTSCWTGAPSWPRSRWSCRWWPGAGRGWSLETWAPPSCPRPFALAGEFKLKASSTFMAFKSDGNNRSLIRKLL